jgi:hypothetical protein
MLRKNARAHWTKSRLNINAEGKGKKETEDADGREEGGRNENQGRRIGRKEDSEDQEGWVE